MEGKSGAAQNVVLALEPGTVSAVAMCDRPCSRKSRCWKKISAATTASSCATSDDSVGTRPSLLRRFLEQGGGVVVCLGDQVQATNYNSILGIGSGRTADAAGAAG